MLVSMLACISKRPDCDAELVVVVATQRFADVVLPVVAA